MRTPFLQRVGQALSKLFFCVRVAGDPGSLLRLLVQSKRHYNKPTPALSYSIRFHAVKRIIHLRTYSGDIRIFYEIFWKRAYWLPADLVGSPRVIVDAGANVGMAALYFSIVYPGARIFCVEPDASNFQLLRENLAEESERVVLIEAALYDRDGSVALAKKRWAYNSKVDDRDEPEGSVTVEAMRMDSLLDQYGLERIDLLKIDVEGAEDKLFGGGLEWLARVGTILIEVHSPEGVGTIGKRLMENGFYWRSWGVAEEGDSMYLASRIEMTRLAKG